MENEKSKDIHICKRSDHAAKIADVKFCLLAVTETEHKPLKGTKPSVGVHNALNTSHPHEHNPAQECTIP
jgi:hypothetical protein